MAPITAPTGAEHARILGVGGYRPSRVVTNAEICERIDSSDEWIRERSGIETPPLGRARRARRRHERRGRRQGARRRPASAPDSRRGPGRHRHPPAADPVGRGRRRRPARRHRRRGRSTSPPPAPASATASRWPTTWSAAAAPSTSWSSASRSSPTSPTPTTASTAFIFGDGAGAVVIGPSDEPGIGPTIWGSDGSQYDAITQQRVAGSTSATTTSTSRTSRMEGQTVFRWAVWQMAPVAQQALDAAGVTRRRPRRVHPAPGQHAHHRRDDQDSSSCPAHVPVARDIARDRQHLGRVDPAGDGAHARDAARPRAAAWRC